MNKLAVLNSYVVTHTGLDEYYKIIINIIYVIK